VDRGFCPARVGVRPEAHSHNVYFNLTAATEANIDYVLKFVELLVLCHHMVGSVACWLKASFPTLKLNLRKDLCLTL
jgi:hypothetical protein